jgi:pimeloyl-ACP methyl ester carboxylesterase
MAGLRKKVVRRAVWGALLVLVLVSVLASCRAVRVIRSRLTVKDEVIPTLFEQQPVKPAVRYWEHQGRRMRYVAIGDSSLPTLLVLHGSPGSWKSWDDVFFDSGIYNHVRIIAPDRPGYGYSNYGHSFRYIQDEAAFLQTFINEIAPRGQLILAGSSYGGSVAVPLAIQNHNRLRSLVLVSASVQPGAEKIYGITPIIRRFRLRALVPKLLRMPNDEKLAHRTSLERITGWESIRCPVYILHGQADELVFFSNAEYAKQHLRNAPVTLIPFAGIGHTINWKMPDTVRHYVRLAIRP